MDLFRRLLLPENGMCRLRQQQNSDDGGLAFRPLFDGRDYTLPCITIAVAAAEQIKGNRKTFMQFWRSPLIPARMKSNEPIEKWPKSIIQVRTTHGIKSCFMIVMLNPYSDPLLLHRLQYRKGYNRQVSECESSVRSVKQSHSEK